MIRAEFCRPPQFVGPPGRPRDHSDQQASEAAQWHTPVTSNRSLVISSWSDQIFTKRARPRAGCCRIAIIDGIWAPVRWTPNLDDLGRNRDEEDHHDDVGVS